MPDVLQQRVKAVEPRLRSELDAFPVFPHRVQQVTHLRQGGASRLLDAYQRLAILGQRGWELVPDGSDLEHHHADGVGDDVVQLTRDPGPFLGHCDPGRGVALPLGLGRPRLRCLGLHGTLAYGETRDPADRELERDDDELAG